MKYLETENTIGKDNIEIPNVIRLFSLDGLGINAKSIIDIFSRSVSTLEWDYYDVRKSQIDFLKKRLPQNNDELDNFLKKYYSGKAHLDEIQHILEKLSPEQFMNFHKIRPHRKRAMSSFFLERKKMKNWDISQNQNIFLSQNVDDYRSVERKYKLTNEEIINNKDFKELLKKIASLVASIKPTVKKLQIGVHEMAIIATEERDGDNSPEGIHQDGCDYIISALVIERKGITGGVSKIYNENRELLYSHKLKVGEGLFQADANSGLLHKVTPVSLDISSSVKVGERNIVGFDIDIIELI